MSGARGFLERWAELEDLGSASALLSWDQETCMPPRGAAGRGRVLAALSGLRHRALVDPALAEALEAWAGEHAGDPVAEAQVREARRRIERARRVPEALARRLAELASRGLEAWRAAREADDFTLFQPVLEEILAAKREEAACLAPEGDPYEALMDEYEPGSQVAELEPLFRDLVAELQPLVRAVQESGPAVDEAPARGHFEPRVQEAFAREMAAAIGFDFEAGRLDASAHPFCTGIQPDDVRITWRWQEDDFRPALFGVLHEAGHGLYEQGLPRDWHRTPLGHAVSLGVHESQSRLWENLVGRSRGFWRFALPRFHAAFPDRREAAPDVETLWPALNPVRPSLIRVEADPVTYNLHIALRFDLERALIAGDLEAADLPGAWDEGMERLLGLRPPSARDGVLQDIHWSMGAFGYFHTYTLGNLIASALLEAFAAEAGEPEEAWAAGDFAPLRDWLRERIHRHGSRFRVPELLEQALGGPLRAGPLLRYARGLVEEAYGLTGISRESR